MTGSAKGSPHPRIRIGKREIGAECEPFIVAEIGTSHGGNREHAHRLIDAAAEAGADCAKFQIVFADEIIHPNTGAVPLPGGETALFERFRGLERDRDFYADLMEYTGKSGMEFLCSVFGLRSARMIVDLGARAVKIASPELNHLPLLREVAAYGLPILLSTGVSLLRDIEQALGVVGDGDVALLHCVTAYPAPPEDYNLRVVSTLEALFERPVGVSDHSLDPVLVPALASAAGAAMVEKHLTLSREGGGLDDPVALLPEELRSMVASCRQARREGLEMTMERFAGRFEPDRIAQVLGTGSKRLAPSEAANYLRTNRSLHAMIDLPAGSTLASDNVGVLRTEKRLRPGISPFMLDLVIGCRTVRDIPAGEGIVWDDLLQR